MKLVQTAIVGVLAAMVAMPTQAWALWCSDYGPVANYISTTDNGERVLIPDTDAQASYDLMRLRQQGVDATRVERWNGCLRAFVTQPGGGETMQFFEPSSLRRLQ